MIHELKSLPGYFRMTEEGKKNFEIRKDDRPFKPGDYIALNEWDGEKYTGRSMIYRITCVFCSAEYCKEGYVILGMETCAIRMKKVPEGIMIYGNENKSIVDMLEAMFSDMALKKTDKEKTDTEDNTENKTKENDNEKKGKCPIVQQS